MSCSNINMMQLAFAIIMGAIAFSVRNAGFYISIMDPFKLDARWVFSLVPAFWLESIGGLISGILAAMKLPCSLIDLACIPVHFIIGIVARCLKKHSKQLVIACFLWPILGVPAYLLMSVLFLPAVNVLATASLLAFIGVSTSILAFVAGYSVEVRAKRTLELLE